MVQKGEVLSRAQLKKVLGGDGSGSCCKATCYDEDDNELGIISLSDPCFTKC